MIQDPAWAKDPLTEGYIGESESSEPEGSDYPQCHPTPPGRLILANESADKLYTMMAGDAKTAYDFCYAGNLGKPQVTPPWTRADHMYPGLLDVPLAIARPLEPGVPYRQAQQRWLGREDQSRLQSCAICIPHDSVRPRRASLCAGGG